MSDNTQNTMNQTKGKKEKHIPARVQYLIGNMNRTYIEGMMSDSDRQKMMNELEGEMNPDVKSFSELLTKRNKAHVPAKAARSTVPPRSSAASET
jgi:hypothetical protein